MAAPGFSTSLLHKSLAEIVTEDGRTASIFDGLGLDYCCHGHQTLQDAAIDVGLPVSDVVDALNRLGPRTADASAVEWPDLAALTKHIVTRHHEYIRRTRPQIAGWLDKLVARHGGRHPELAEVRRTFAQLADELITHAGKEENILFPYIDALATAAKTGERLPAGPFGTILNPIRIMEQDHREAGELLAQLRQLTSNYALPSDACTTYRLCYQELARFQSDLHRHVHLENNVLFPRALALEDELS